MFFRSLSLALFLASSTVAATELRGAASAIMERKLFSCDCATDKVCKHNTADVCYKYQGPMCPAGSTDVCGTAPSAEECECGSALPCTHNNDGTCLALNAQGKCPSGSTNACGLEGDADCVCQSDKSCEHNNDGTCLGYYPGTTQCVSGSTEVCDFDVECLNDKPRGQMDTGCPDPKKRICVGPDGAEPPVKGSECVRCVNSGDFPDVDYGCWKNKPLCKMSGGGEPMPGKKGAVCEAIPADPGNTKNCSDFATWAEANEWFQMFFPFYGDVARLDGDGDGVPCESLPGAP